MVQEPNEQTRGKTGEQVNYGGQYAAEGCCRTMMWLKKGDMFPVCPQHATITTWGWIPPGSGIGLADIYGRRSYGLRGVVTPSEEICHLLETIQPITSGMSIPSSGGVFA